MIDLGIKVLENYFTLKEGFIQNQQKNLLFATVEIGGKWLTTKGKQYPLCGREKSIGRQYALQNNLTRCIQQML